MRKPRYIVTQCSWCQGDHWHVVRNILTSRAVPASATYTDKTLADADAEQRNQRWKEKHANE